MKAITLILLMLFISPFVVGKVIYGFGDAHSDQSNPAATAYTGNFTYTTNRASNAQRAYYQFNLTNLSGQVTSANFTFYLETIYSLDGTFNFSFYACYDTTNASWNEASLTWNSQDIITDSCAASPFYTKIANTYTAKTFYYVNITPIINSEYALDKHFIIKVKASVETGGSPSKFISIGTTEAPFTYRPRVDFTYASNGSAAPSITVLHPNTTIHYGLLSPYNGSIILSSNIPANCTLNDTRWTLSRNVGNIITFQNNTAIGDGTYIVEYRCNSTATSWTNLSINFTLDYTKPIARIIWPGNGSRIWELATPPFQVSFYDKYLYKANITFYNSSGTMRWFVQNISFSGVHEWWNYTKLDIEFNKTYVSKNAPIPWEDIVTIRLTATDTHTATLFSENVEAKVVTKDGLIKTTYEMDYGDFTQSLPTGITTKVVEDYDRWHFEYSSDDDTAPGKVSMYLSASQIKYLPLSPWKCHFVLNDRYWWDCEGLKDSKVTQVDATTYRIDFMMDTEKVMSDSIGGLNNITVDYQYILDYSNASIIYNSSSSTESSITLQFNTSELANYSYHIGTSCALSDVANGSGVHAIEHTITQGGLVLNTTYYINISTMWDSVIGEGIYHITTGRNSSCFGITTLSNQVTVGADLTVNGSVLMGYCNVTHAMGKNISINYSWFLNGEKISEGMFGYSNVRMNEANKTGVFGAWITDGQDTNDQDWTSYAWGNSSYTFANYNFSKPKNTFNASWMFGIGTTWMNQYDKNLANYSSYHLFKTSLLDTCLSTNTTNLYLNSSVVTPGTTYIMRGYCWNGTAYTGPYSNTLFNTWPDQTRDSFYDMYVTYGIWKNVSDGKYSVSNFTPTEAGTYTFECYATDMDYDATDNSSTATIPLFNFTFMDESTGFVIDFANVSVELISLDYNYSVNGTSDAGFLNITPSYLGEYRIDYWADGYYKRSYYFDASSSFYMDLTLYLLNTTEGSRIIHHVFDQSGGNADNITVVLQRQYGANYYTVSISRTNFEGDTVLYAQLYDIWYKLIYYTNDGRLLRITDPSPFLDTSTDDQVSLNDDSFFSWRVYSNV